MMKIQLWKLSEIHPYEKNPRRNDCAVDAVARSIQRFGFLVPIVVDGTGEIVAGDTRLKAAAQLGLEEVPVLVATDLTREQIRAFRIADNQTASLAGWNFDRLTEELRALEQAGFDMDAMGFSGAEMERLLSGDALSGLADPDQVPAPPDEPITRTGDLWELGDHLLLSGDAGSAEDFHRLLGGVKVQATVCDPPYGVGVSPRSNAAIAAGNSSFATAGGSVPAQLRAKDRPLANDSVSKQEFSNLLLRWFGSIAKVMEPGRCYHIFGGYENLASFPAALEQCNFHHSQPLVWVKGHPVINRRSYMSNFELIFFGWLKGGPHQFYGPANEVDVWEVKKVAPQCMEHLTQKPVEVMVRAIKNTSRRGEHILDPFAGSGTVMIACEQTERRCFSMEVDPLYVDVAVSRWERFTGQTAVRHEAAHIE